MSDEVWWAMRCSDQVFFYASQKEAETLGRYFWCCHLRQWGLFGGPLLADDEIIPIRPLRIERVEVKNG